MSERSLKEAMILGAGFGTRMRDLTTKVPKPMLRFGKKTLLEHALTHLQRHGIERFAVNTHHHRELFENYIKDLQEKFHISAFPESPQILGTGGGIKQMSPHIHESDFVISNCDFLTNIDLGRAFAWHIERNADVTMVLIQPKHAQNYGSVSYDENCRVQAFLKKEDGTPASGHWVFSGLHIVRKDFLKTAPKENSFCVIENWYKMALDQGARIMAFCSDEHWIDVGEKELFEKERAAHEAAPFHWL